MKSPARPAPAQQEAYWMERLRRPLPILELPTDFPRPPIQAFTRGRVEIDLDSDLARGIGELCGTAGTTLFVALLAAFKTALMLYTGGTDLIIGSLSPDSLRGSDGGLQEPFTNPVPLRTHLGGDPSFLELLRRVAATVDEAASNRDTPFERLVLMTGESGSLARAPVFQVMLAFTGAPGGLSGVAVTQDDLDRVREEVIRCDLVALVSANGEALRLACEYDAALFKSETVALLLTGTQDLLLRCTADPRQRLSALEDRRTAAAGLRRAVRTVPLGFDELYRRSNLTRNQLLIWIGQQLQPDVPVYNIAGTLTLPVAVNLDRFQRAFTTVLDSSDSLRTVFEEKDGVPYQRVLPSLPYTIECVDLTRDPDPRRACLEWVRRRSGTQFDFGKRLFETVLLRLSETDSVIYYSQHHLISDGWAISLVAQHVSDLYSQAVTGPIPERIDLPQFQVCVDHERLREDSERQRDADAYWERKLSADVEPVVFYGKPPIKRTTFVHRVGRELGPDLSRELKARASKKEFRAWSLDSSLFNIFAVCTLTYLHRMCGSRLLSLGIPFHNRSSKVSKETIGPFLKVLPLHFTIDTDETFRSLAGKVRSEMLETLRNGQYAVGNPLRGKAYDVFLNYHREIFPNFGGTPGRYEWVHTGHENDSLALQIRDFESAGNLALDFDFHRDLFSEEQQDRAIGHFLHVLDAFLADDTRLLRMVPLLPDHERTRVLVGFNRSEAAVPHDRTFPELFEEQVKRSPDRVAVRCQDRSLTYAALNERANHLARSLVAEGVGPDRVVVLLAERGLDFLTGVLAVWKAGGAYLPIDPRDPRERWRQVLDSSRVAFALVTGEFAGRIKESLPAAGGNRGVTVMVLEDLLSGAERAESPSARCGPGNLAYVIYTSGSTGVPKGAMVEQRGMVNHLFAKVLALNLTEQDVLAQNASQCFDISVWQYLATLLVGGMVDVIPDEIAHDPARLLAQASRGEITVLETVPSLLRAMLDTVHRGDSPPPDLRALRWMVPTGEALPVELCRDWFRLYPGIPLLNAYGPTECSDDVTHHVMVGPPADDVTLTPIGSPVANLRLFILDEMLDPVPIGVPGELCVGGVGVGRGYMNDPGRTAAAFVPDPFGPEPGARIYRTGDLSRHLPDGKIEFLGRFDDQVKIRGFRIELGEIETVLGQHPGVTQCLVMARKEGAGEADLVAYLVPDQNAMPSAHDLRALLTEKLPRYMVPAAFVMLEAFPLTPNGKIDRSALPRPETAELARQAPFVAPRNPVEDVLAGIWAEVLGVERVGIHDGFFDLGGHSLLATQVLSRAREALDAELPLRGFFESPTVAGLADAMLQDPGERERLTARARAFLLVSRLSDEEVDMTLAGRPDGPPEESAS